MKLYSIFDFLVWANNKGEAIETFMKNETRFICKPGYNLKYFARKYVNYLPFTVKINDTMIIN